MTICELGSFGTILQVPYSKPSNNMALTVLMPELHVLTSLSDLVLHLRAPCVCRLSTAVLFQRRFRSFSTLRPRRGGCVLKSCDAAATSYGF